MPRTDNELKLTPSILDRLIDEDPGSAVEISLNESWDLNMIVESVRQDIESLLNTRVGSEEEIPSEFEESRKSLITYGLPDLTVFHLKNDQDKRKLTRLIESTIRKFEPRLRRVRVSLQSMDEFHSALRFKIEGILRVEPGSERVVFDTALELNSGEYKVEGGK